MGDLTEKEILVSHLLASEKNLYNLEKIRKEHKAEMERAETKFSFWKRAHNKAIKNHLDQKKEVARLRKKLANFDSEHRRWNKKNLGKTINSVFNP